MAATRSRRQQQRNLITELRGQRYTWARIAQHFCDTYRVTMRAGLRMAHDWSQRDAAEQWNLRWPDEPKTFKNFSYWELWPGPSGHAPSLDVLSRLAELYECSISDLVSDCADFRALDVHHEPELPDDTRVDKVIGGHSRTHSPEPIGSNDEDLPEKNFATLVSLERSARRITVVTPLRVPGLLQTPDYAHALMRSAGLPEQEAVTRVAVRMWRRSVLGAHNSTRFVALVGESALRQAIGGTEVTLEQLRFLVEAAAMEAVDLRVVADRNDWHPGLEGSFVFVEFADRSPVVQIENRRAAVYLEQDEDVRAYRKALEKVTKIAMTPDDSLAVLRGAITHMEHGR